MITFTESQLKKMSDAEVSIRFEDRIAEVVIHMHRWIRCGSHVKCEQKYALDFSVLKSDIEHCLMPLGSFDDALNELVRAR